MDKIVKLLIVLLVLTSCSRKETFDEEKNQIVFKYDKFIEVNFQTKMLKINYIGLKYTGGINFSKNEYDLIIKSYNKNNIGVEKGIFDCFDNNSFMPPFNDEIRIYHFEKLYFKSIINSNYNYNKSSISDQEYRIISFRNDIKKVLENNRDFKKALDTLHKFQEQKKVIFL